MKKRIVNTGMEPHHSHRPDFRSCPHCDHEMESDEWLKAAHTLALESRCYKSNSVSIIRECPTCFEDSWIHYPLDVFYVDDLSTFPKTWSTAAIKERRKRIASATRLWNAGLCSKCSRNRGKRGEYNAFYHCDRGSGHPRKTCKRFRKRGKT